ncbi:prolyl 4-hydroxylase subunit alpha-1-like [Drosophila rhopaloa]|uniref:Prolyl 4-hydroxylase N-terminal domain-containing protein n=1 Tax=Drosophila rhopaloa TaxID=1041015 RepID=A0ABM5J6N7_DRORH|nr:prolyl 4-hydroxylase subunit alpha-1-like [Drosophila rhopaloa]
MANFGLVFFIIFSLVFTHGQMVHHRFARSMSSMDNLLKLIEDLAFNLEYYAADLAKKAHTINKGIDQMMKRHLQVQEKSKHFWGSPFNSFTLIRHMKADWISWKIYMKKPVGLDKLAYLESKKHSLPQKWDFAEAAEGIRRMQLVYGMSAKDIANGLLNGVQYNSSLTARDCLEMGVHLMKTSRWLDSENWIREGFRALERSDPQPEMDLLRAPISSELYRTLARIRQMQSEY